MYLKLVLAACFLAFCAGVFSAYARLSDAGLGCANWPACYEENALKEKQLSQADASRNHSSWKWRLQNITGMILGMLSIAICSIAWQKRRELRQSPLLPTMLLALIAFLGAFGIWAFSHLPRSVIVPVHLAGGSAMLIVLTWIALHQIKYSEISAGVIRHWSRFSRLAFVMVLAQTLQGAWLSSNFAALACTDLPLCNGLLLPAMDFSFSLERYGPPLSVEQLVSIHWIHRVGALLVLVYLGWLSIMLMAVEALRAIGKTLLGLLAFQFVLGISSVALGLPLAIAVLHNATAMLLLVVLAVLNFRLRIGEKKKI